jgi:hypothetical protein
MIRATAIAAAALSLAAGHAAPPHAPVRYEVIAVSGQDAPGIPGARFFRTDTTALFAPVFESLHGYAFVARVEGPTVTDADDTGIWAASAAPQAPLRLVARTGQPAPSAGDVVFANFRSQEPLATLPVNAQGQVSFHGSLASASGSVTPENAQGLWIATPGEGDAPFIIESVARTGDVAPETGGARFLVINEHHMLNDLGDVLFRATLQWGAAGVDETNDTGLWLSRAPVGGRSARTLEPVAREGSAAPGLNATFDHFYGTISSNGVEFTIASLSDTGIAAFTVGLIPDGQTSATEASMWTSLNGQLALIAKTGDLCPDTSGAPFRFFGRPMINASGDLAFRALLDTSFPGITSANRCVLCAVRTGALELVLRDAEPAPGIFNHTTDLSAYAFRVFPRINATGNIAFTAGLNSSEPFRSTSALWTFPAPDPAPTLIARDYGELAGATGCFFSPFESDITRNAFSINPVGDVAFYNGSSSPCWHGIWLHRAAATDPIPVCILGETEINVAPSGAPADIRRVRGLEGTYVPPAPSLSHLGDVTFAVNFDDDSMAVVRATQRPGPRSPADLDGDEVVTAADFTILAASFGQSVPAGTAADINADGVVNAADFLLLARDFGRISQNP